jgi:predicted TIM-barrel enzyme|tara:strand:- start:580 stop:987 length:408 start_codon:yes stop_codon:yes gene_type:complete
MSTTITTSNSILRARSKQETLTTTQDIKANDAGAEFNIATDAIVLSLPAITAQNIGAEFTFRNTGADAANIITISPDAADSINGAVAAVSSGGTAGKDWINTKATSTKGDWVTLKAVALTEWYITGGDGVWASEA